MAGTVEPLRARTDASFALESLDVDDGRLIVSGHWDGVRGLRFVRPTLVAGDREVLATLEHKPWAPDGDPWVAAFPWDGGAVDADDLALSVAPSVTVPLGARPPKAQKARAPLADALRDRLRSLEIERDALRARLDEAVADREAALRTRRRMEAQRDEAFAERNAAERERDHAVAARDQAEARRDEAIRDHEVAMRTHRKLQAQRDEAVAALNAAEAAREQALDSTEMARGEALKAAEAAREQALADRDEARAERDELRRQRDDALLAHAALRRRIEEEKARSVRAAEEAAPPRDIADDDAPIGVRTVPAARSLAADLDGPPPGRVRGLTTADRVAIRIFSSIAAVCGLLLLVNLLRVFV